VPVSRLPLPCERLATSLAKSLLSPLTIIQIRENAWVGEDAALHDVRRRNRPELHTAGESL